jgi:F0F1-type ATP synthase assembly protein I
MNYLNNNKNLKAWYAVSVAFQLGFLIVFQIGGFMLLGYYIDRYFKTMPYGVITGMIVGVIMAVIETYQLIIPLIRNGN